MQSGPKQGSTGEIYFTLHSQANAEKVSEKMQDSLFALFKKVRDAQKEYSTYVSQKSYIEKSEPDSIEEYKGLIAKDFADFKEQLNEVIREFNKFKKDYGVQLAILGKDHESVCELAEIEGLLNQLKQSYNQDKSQYVGVPLPKVDTDIVSIQGSTTSNSNEDNDSTPSRSSLVM